MDNKLNLSALTLKNYKNLVADGIGLNNLNVFIGPNGSGKSNFIGVLRFLKDCLISTPDKSRGITSFEEAFEKLGGTSASILDKTETSDEPGHFVFAFKFSGEQILFFDLAMWTKIVEESLYSSGIAGTDNFCFYKLVHSFFNVCEVSVYNDSTQTESHIETLSNVPNNQLALSLIPELLESSKFPPEKTPIYKVRRQIIDAVSGWRFYNANDMNVNAIRVSEPKIGPGDMFLEPSGENMPLVSLQEKICLWFWII